MLLQKLDVPQVMPQTMAFVVDRARVTHFRQALRAVLEEGSIAPWRQFCAGRRVSFINQWNEAQVSLDVSQIKKWFELARLKDKTLPSRGFVNVAAQRYLELIHSLDWLEEGEQWALHALTSLRKPADDEALELPAPKDISWVRELRFVAGANRTSRSVMDPLNDEVLGIPESMDFGDMSPLDTLELVRSQISSPLVLEMLAAPFTQSIGPGPFMAPPLSAASLQDPEWQVLPLFDVIHRKWPLVDGHVLGGKTLLEAQEEVRQASPSRAWHTSFAKLDTHRWAALTDEHWERCRNRFADALDLAYRRHEAVLLLPNDRSKPFWSGPDWPATVPGGELVDYGALPAPERSPARPGFR